MEIVGLKNFVQDDVNKLIAKFVGMPVHPIAKALQNEICKIYKIKTFGKFENEKLRKDFRQSIFNEIRYGWYCGGKRMSHKHCCYYSHDWENRLDPKLTGMIWKRYSKMRDKEEYTEDERCYFCKNREYHHLRYNNLNGYRN